MAILCCTLAAIIAGVWLGGGGRSAMQDPIPSGILSDPEVHCRIARRVHHGESYYDAAGAELRANGYGTKSIFNWRQPLYAWWLAALPSFGVARALLALLGVSAIALVARSIYPTMPLWRMLLTVWFLGMACFYCFVPWGIGVVEAWAGVLILISATFYAEGHWIAGLMLGLLALFFRELAAPYVIVCAVIAGKSLRWKEVGGWAAGVTCYGIYFGVHIHHVLQHIRASDVGYSSGWVQLGGIHFILETGAQTLLLMPMPLWVTGIYLPLSLLGLFAVPNELGLRASATVATYLVLFAVIGKPVNDYWGFLYGPLLALGLPWLCVAVLDLFEALRVRETHVLS